MEGKLYAIISTDKELTELYQNDAEFKTAVIASTIQNQSIEESLINILKVGYKSKNITMNRFINHVQKCGFLER